MPVQQRLDELQAVEPEVQEAALEVGLVLVPVATGFSAVTFLPLGLPTFASWLRVVQQLLVGRVVVLLVPLRFLYRVLNPVQL